MNEPIEERPSGDGEPPLPAGADPVTDAADDTAKGDKPAAEEEGPQLLARGNPLRTKRGGVTTAIGVLGLFLLMAKNVQWRTGVPLGFLFVCIAAWGVMDLVGSFDDAAEDVAARSTLAKLLVPLGVTAGAIVVFGLTLGLAGAGYGEGWLWMILVPAAFLGLVMAIFGLGRALGPWATDERGEDRPLLRRHGFWVVLVAGLLYFPTMGTFSLWDPWETHYGEVAREILARDDWISLWWAQDGWFWSKPILNFWMQSVAMGSLGTHYRPDLMLVGAHGAIVARPEWVVRAPNVLLTILAMYAIYKGSAKVFGRRAGMLGAFVLATVPDWYFLAHQTMTDMPFVAAMTAAMGLLMMGLYTDEERRVRLFEVETSGGTKYRFSAWHVVFGVILVCVIPQVVYLASRNIELIVSGPGPKGFRVHWDEFQSGSGGNCGLPGNEACRTVAPASIPRSVGSHPEGIWNMTVRLFGGFEPFIQALLWAGVLGGLLYLNWGERRLRRLYYVAAWFFAAIATMGKGPAGFVLPIICAFAYIATKKRWGELLRIELLSGLLVILCVALPWFVAMYVRHGSPFTDRLIFHDMFNRAFGHVHDTNEGDDTSFRFYIWQLGYALFPWTGLAPLGLTYWLRRGDSAGHGKQDASVLLVMWFVFAFALFTFMGTKFHHYIFPAVPPVAMLVGVVLDDMLGSRPVASGSRIVAYLGVTLAGAGVSVYGVSRFFPGSIWGPKDPSVTIASLHAPALWTAIALTAVGAACLVVGPLFFGQRRTQDDDLREIEEESALRGADDDRPTASTAAPPAPAAPYRGPGKIDTFDEKTATALAHERLMVGGAILAGAAILVLVGRDLAMDAKFGDQPGAIRLLHLFTYNYRRAWPESLDFSAALAAIAIVGVALTLALTVRRVRHHATAVFVSFAFVAALWGLDVYMIKTAPHWGQHEVIEAYYRDRKGPDEVLVAYQMNWKGENFYTSNKVPAFVSTGGTFTTWLKQQRDKGAKVMYFVTEHGRTGGLRSEVSPKSYKEITDKVICNKFVLVRTEL